MGIVQVVKDSTVDDEDNLAATLRSGLQWWQYLERASGTSLNAGFCIS